MAKSVKVSEDELLKLVSSSIDAAEKFDRSELSARRKKALEYYQGVMEDVPAQDGRSSVTARTLSEHMGWVLPGIMRTFLSSDKIAVYEPQRPGDEEVAKQATDYVNYVFMRECAGYAVFRNAAFDGFLNGNGIGKVWWDKSPEYTTHDYTGLTDEAYTAIAVEDGVEVLQHTEEPQMVLVPGPDGQPVETPVTFHDCKIRRTVTTGRLRVVSMPPEEFLIRKDAPTLQETTFAAHRYKATRESLVKQGYDKDKVILIGRGSDVDSSEEKLARFDDATDDDATSFWMEEVEVFESYIQADCDGDGHSEWRQVVTGGNGDTAVLLSNEEYGDDLPFFDFVPMPRPHRWDGRSFLDEVEDLQKVTTVVTRQTLDNLYHANNPRTVAVQNQLHNPEVLESRDIGQTIMVKSLDALSYDLVPFVANHSYQMLEYLEMIGEKRTGVSRQSTGLDPDALQDQTATQFNGMQSASYAKQELYARNLAEGGVRDLFRKMLRLIVKHQDVPRSIRLRDQWVDMDPRGWNAEMDCTVSVGLGSGSRERDIQMLMATKAAQEAVIANFGPDNPLCDLVQYGNTLGKLVEATGLKSPEQYFKSPDPQAIEEYKQKMASKPDPKQEELQAKMQLEQGKAQITAQSEQQKMQLQAMLQQSELQIKREQLEAEMALKREQLAAEIQLKREQFAAELALKREMGFVDASVKASTATSSVHMGGEPG